MIDRGENAVEEQQRGGDGEHTDNRGEGDGLSQVSALSVSTFENHADLSGSIDLRPISPESRLRRQGG